jgi:hypothetical protein
MTRDTAKDFLPLVQALSEGKVIQWFNQEDSGWEDLEFTDFVEAPDRYRVKPERREVWVNEYPDGIYNGNLGPHKTRCEADAVCGKNRIAVIRFVEAERIEVK